MKILNVEQGSPEWLRARLGIPTASQVDRLLTPKTLKISSQAGTYRNQLLAEWWCGYPIDWGGQSSFMERGTDMEPEARAWYELQRDVEATQVGFVLRDDGRFGGSPDSLVGEDGGLEIKCPALHTHLGYLLDPEALTAEYRGQVQAYLYLTGRAWWDLLAYNPELPPVVRRVERDELYIAALDKVLAEFLGELERARAVLEQHRAPAGGAS